MAVSRTVLSEDTTFTRFISPEIPPVATVKPGEVIKCVDQKFSHLRAKSLSTLRLRFSRSSV